MEATISAGVESNACCFGNNKNALLFPEERNDSNGKGQSRRKRKKVHMMMCVLFCLCCLPCRNKEKRKRKEWEGRCLVLYGAYPSPFAVLYTCARDTLLFRRCASLLLATGLDWTNEQKGVSLSFSNRAIQTKQNTRRTRR